MPLPSTARQSRRWTRGRNAVLPSAHAARQVSSRRSRRTLTRDAISLLGDVVESRRARRLESRRGMRNSLSSLTRNALLRQRRRSSSTTRIWSRLAAPRKRTGRTASSLRQIRKLTSSARCIHAHAPWRTSALRSDLAELPRCAH
jgi:hypothetical protein